MNLTLTLLFFTINAKVNRPETVQVYPEEVDYNVYGMSMQNTKYNFSRKSNNMAT